VENTQEAIRSWFHQQHEQTMPHGDLLESFHRQHPSKVFLRSLPLGAKVLDVGAGDGGLSIFKKWPSPARPDLRLYAFSIEKGARFADYDGFEIGDWNKTKPVFDGMQFDAVVCANFIEHIDQPASLFTWAASALKPNGRIYVEWPSDASRFCPTLPQLAEIGFGCVIGNYFDDPTHRKHLPSTGFVKRHLRRRGFAVEAAGIIRMPLMATELLSHYRATGDLVSLQLAYWLRTGWIQYITATKSYARNARLATRLRMLVKRPPHFGDFAEAMRSR